jgi:hypothetical protein
MLCGECCLTDGLGPIGAARKLPGIASTRSSPRLACLVALSLLIGSPLFAQSPCLSATVSGSSPADLSWTRGSTYLPVDSWVYPALDRLHALGYLDGAFLDLRPWTRLRIARMLAAASDRMHDEEREWLLITQEKGAEPGGASGREARSLLAALNREFAPDLNTCGAHAELDTVYSRSRGITDTPLRDSYHLGQTLVNDYGRPYQAGFNQYTGASGRIERGRFSLYFRGEYQHAPSALGYTPPLFDLLSTQVDLIPVASNPMQSTIPLGPIASANDFRMLEANASYRILGHEISFGKSDHWMGPAAGGAFAWSDNAENIYAFQIDRADPLHIPLLSDVIGPVRYQFFVGSLKGHTAPNDPWVHAEKISFDPTPNLEFGFERTVIWGGQGHVPITIDSFLRSFFSVQNISVAEKNSRKDPGARFGAFDFSWRLPYLRNWVTLYTDSESHDDVSPISAPRRAGIRPGFYLSHVPGLPKLDLRVEAATSDPPVSNSTGGRFLSYENIQQQGPTNQGFLFGDAIGREDKGGNAWLTWHFSPQEQLQVSWRGVKAAKDFIPDGTTQNDFRADGVKRLGADRDLEVHAWVQYEAWKAPIYRPGAQSDTTVAGELIWYPHLSRHF